MTLYVGNDDAVTQKVKKAYVGVDGIGRNIKAMYVGDDNGIARKVFPDGNQRGGLLFTSPNPFSLKLTSRGTYTTTAKIYKSKDEIDWEETDGLQMDAYSSNTNGYLLYIRTDDYLNTDDPTVYKNNHYQFSVLTGNNISVSQDIKHICGDKEMRTAYAYGLFREAQGIISAKKLIFGTETARDCYAMMFMDSSLIEIPKQLPALSAAWNCYFSMFENTKVVNVTLDLPATFMEQSCYDSMFYKCKELETLNMTISTSEGVMDTSGWGCQCYCMFYECENLKNTPMLPCKNLASSAYYEMFLDCYNLEETCPVLPATILPDWAYYCMFLDCYKLTSAPDFSSAITVGLEACYLMFGYCHKLVDICELPATTLGDSCYDSMFVHCELLEVPPSKLPATNIPYSAYSQMFDGCCNLKTIPEFPVEFTNLGARCFEYMFRHCNGLYWGTTGNSFKINCSGTIGDRATRCMFDKNSGSYWMSVGWGNMGTPAINTTYYYRTSTYPEISGTDPQISNSLRFVGDLPFAIGLYSTGSNLAWRSNAVISYSNDGITWFTGEVNKSENCGQFIDGAGKKKYALWVKTSDYINDTSSYSQTKVNQYTFYGADYANSKLAISGPLQSINGNKSMAVNYAPYLFSNLTQSLYDSSGLILPTTTAYCCYQSMFEDCKTMKKTIPVISADPTFCSYWAMFKSCNALEEAPQLTFTSIFNSYACYEMFRGCSNLTELPDIHVTNINYDAAFSYMFAYTGTGMKTTTPTVYWYQFTGNNSDVPYRIPVSGTGILSASNALNNMFYGCKGSLPEGNGTPLVNTTYYYKPAE